MAGADRTPSVVVSHLDIVYRVYGARARTGESRSIGAMLRGADRAPRTVHAVKDVSFVAHHGESVGIIGRNGSGKSTLLRAVAGLIPPTNGEVFADGSPALLGVNAVLVQSLSGARNIYIGAQALGLSKAEVDAVYDEIVEFSELGDAIHRPMATYSSGMAGRLRFAISTAAAPGVLIIDEALATGDAHFRARSEERINALRERASTVFLVSHSANTVREMCDRALWLDQGTLIMDGPVDEVVGAYEDAGRTGRWGSAPAPEPNVPGVERWFGPDRYTTAATTSARCVEPRPDRVFLAPGQDASTALALVPEAVRSSSPVLLVRQRTIPPSVLKELRRLDPETVVLVGDERTILPAVEQALTGSGFTVERLDGGDPVRTVAGVVRDSKPPQGSTVYLVPHGDEKTALVATMTAVDDEGVVLLVEPGEIPAEVLDVLAELAPREIRVLADDAVVPDATIEELGSLTEGSCARFLSPSPPQATASVSAGRRGREQDVVYVASAIPDAVTGTYVAGISDVSLLLIDRDEVPPAVHEELRRLHPAHIVVLGGPPSVTPAVRQSLADYLRAEEQSEAETLDEVF